MFAVSTSLLLIATTVLISDVRGGTVTLFDHEAETEPPGCMTQSWTDDEGNTLGAAGVHCLFPFTDVDHPGIVYSGCSRDDTVLGEPAWCSVEGGANDSDWGYCPPSCKHDVTDVLFFAGGLGPVV